MWKYFEITNAKYFPSLKKLRVASRTQFLQLQILRRKTDFQIKVLTLFIITNYISSCSVLLHVHFEKNILRAYLHAIPSM